MKKITNIIKSVVVCQLNRPLLIIIIKKWFHKMCSHGQTASLNPEIENRLSFVVRCRTQSGHSSSLCVDVMLFNIA